MGVQKPGFFTKRRVAAHRYESALLTDSNNNLRVLRGGLWLNTSTDCRSAYRYKWNLGDRVKRFGSRIVYPIVWTS